MIPEEMLPVSPLAESQAASAPASGPAVEGDGPAEAGQEHLHSAQGTEAIPAKQMPSPRLPTADEIATHNLTHLPYKSWCRYCIMSRRPNEPHRSKGPLHRDVPLLVGD